MTKLLTIEVGHDPEKNEIIYIAHVIANDQEGILILKDLIDDREKDVNFHCEKVKLNYCNQFAYEYIPKECAKGQILIRLNKDMDMDEAIAAISKTIHSLIL